MSNEAIIRQFIERWSGLDAGELASYFTIDGCYHNMPAAPICGRDKVEAFIGSFIADWSSTEWDVVNILAADNLVMVERLDRTKVGDKKVNLPCLGVFEMEDGKIKIWRDYFDMSTYVRAMA